MNEMEVCASAATHTTALAALVGIGTHISALSPVHMLRWLPTGWCGVGTAALDLSINQDLILSDETCAAAIAAYLALAAPIKGMCNSVLLCSPFISHHTRCAGCSQAGWFS